MTVQRRCGRDALCSGVLQTIQLHVRTETSNTGMQTPTLDGAATNDETNQISDVQ